MIRKFSFVSLCASLLIVTALTSCSSDTKEGDETSSDVAEATADATDASGDVAVSEDSGSAGDMAEQEPAAEQPVEAAANPEEPLAENQPAEEAVKTDEFSGEAAQNTDPNANPGDAPPAEFADTPPPAEAPAPDVAQTDSPPADQSGDLFGGAAGAAATTDTGMISEDAPKKSLPLAHLKDAPFKRGGQLLNTAYLAREGDTLETVSEKLFGENKVKMLKKGNPAVKKKLRTGDKIYFNSPNRPEDSERMITVYEDQGLPPTTYTTKEGDTLKSLAMEWYGSEASYKEIYSINKNLSSTRDLPAGTDLQYWPASVSVVSYGAKKDDVVAGTPPPPPENTAPVVAAPELPPPPAQLPAPPAPEIAALPPPPDLNAPPLPPPPSIVRKKSSAADAMDKDTIMYVVAAGVLLIGGGLIVALRKRNNKRSQGMTQI